MMEWMLSYDGFDPGQEGLREALCTLGNGYFATRGAAEEAEAGDIHYPGTYFAGGYNRLQTDVGGRVIENEDLINLPNWLPLTFRPADGEWLNLLAAEILSYRQQLDLTQVVLRREMHVRDRQGLETTATSRRIEHMGTPHLAAIEWSLKPENWSGRTEVLSALDGRVINAGVPRYRQLNSKHLTPVETKEIGEDRILLVVEISQSLVVSDQGMHQVLASLLPGFTWLTWPSFFLGLFESFVYGRYAAVVFVPFYNWFAARLG